MSQLTVAGAVMLTLVVSAFAVADETKITITVDRAQPVAVSARAPFDGKRSSVDVAILLDTSNSMDGLISQAKSQLWTIVQQFANAKKNGLTPILRVALFEYGNTRLPASEGYLRQVVPLTDDLDKLSESLFGLTTSGGDEYCGQVIAEAVKRLDWSKEPRGYKAIFIAGNEPFTQGPIPYTDACKSAIERGIIVNTIHCGNAAEGVRGKWQHGAQLAEGESFNIDQDRAVVQIKCPQDVIIFKLSADLNKTYLWYGDKSARENYAKNQVAQDNNASSLSAGVASTRAVAKASGAYNNENRDLVDALKKDKEILKRLRAEELPEELKNKSPEACEAYVKEMTAKRADIQKQINALAVERETFIAKEQRRLADKSGNQTLGDAVVSTLQKQLAKSGFETSTEK